MFLKNRIIMDDNVSISGLTFELNVFYILEKFKSLNQNILVVTNSPEAI